MTINFSGCEIKSHEIRTGDNANLLSELLVNIDTIFLMVDVTSNKTLDDISKEITFLKNDLKFNKQIILVSNKIDMNNKRKISKLDISTLAKNLQLKLVEISIKDNINVVKLFNSILIENSNSSKNNLRPLYTETTNSNSKSDTVYKILLLGNSSVGKTSFFKRYFNNIFTDLKLESIGNLIWNNFF